MSVLGDISSVATAVGALLAGSQLFIFQQTAKSQFEDGLTAQYRAVIRRLPIEALLGRELTQEQYVEALPDFYHYFDLCNEQAYLRQRGRIRRRTWDEWQDGIRQTLARPAFARAWSFVAARSSDSFDALRSIAPPSNDGSSLLP